MPPVFIRAGIVAALIASAPCTAADFAPSSTLPSMLQAVLGLAAVLAAIWGAAWAMRRFSPTRSSASPIRILGAQAVGQRERVVLIEVADTWLLVGVAPGHVSALQTLAKGVIADPAPGGNATFDRLLSLARSKRER